MNTTSKLARPAVARPVRPGLAPGALAAAVLVLAAAWPLAAQDSVPYRLWAAQTGPNQVSLAWDSVPETAEYQIFLGDPDAPATFTGRPVTTLSGSARGAILTGMQRMTDGITLVALDKHRRVRRKTRFNSVVPATSFPPPTPPTGLTAEAPSASEVTVTWNSVPGATAYFIGRAVFRSGFRVVCAVCSNEPRYVDRNVTAGQPHTYTVAAIFPNGVSKRVTSNTVTPGETVVAASTPPAATPTPPTGAPPGRPTGATNTPATVTPPGRPAGGTTPPGTPQPAADSAPPLVNPQIPATVPDSAPPPIGAAPSGADSLALPPADTESCVAARVPTVRDTVERIDVRAERIDLRTTSNPDATATGNPAPVDDPYVASPEYQEGKCLNPGTPGYPRVWDGVASTSGMTSAEQIAAWKEIGVIALEYHHILGRKPTPDETRRDVAALRAGTTWQQLWRALAHSAERDTRFGYWAAAPIPDSLQAQRDFGLAVPPWASQQCYGGFGPRCGGGIPEEVNNLVSPHWFGVFRMPDNTELAYVEIGVGVGAILHDNACLEHKDGLNCNGLGAGDLVKTGLWAAGLEWNKAAWNVIDQRTWRARFGPYPTDPRLRERNWYDDLRPATARFTMMEPAVSMFSWPGLTVHYTGGETRQSRALLAPPGTSLDVTDVAFCQSGAFSTTGSFPGKASWGVCK